MTNIDGGLDPEWSYITAFEASATDTWFYSCEVSLGRVLNAVIPGHELRENVTALAASAIALQGYGASQKATSDNTTQQFQSYPADSTYGAPQAGNATRMAMILSGFATGVVAVTAQANSNIHAPGLAPLRGVTLKIQNWKYVHIILCLILGVHLLLGLVSSLLANAVAVRGHSYLGIADLLRLVSQKLSYYRCHGPHEKDNGPLDGPEPTLRYHQSRIGDYSFQTGGQNFAYL